MANAGTLTLDLQLKSAQFVNGLKQIQKDTERTAAAVTQAFDLMKGAAGAFAGALAIDALAGAIQRAFDYADAIQDLSDRTGASVENLQKFRYAAQMTGSGFEEADAALEKFSNQLGKAANGNDQMAKKFENLGVSTNNVDKALGQAMDGISKLPTAQQRAAATTELFGKKAQTLTNLMSQGSKGFEEMGEKAEDLGIILDSGLIANAGKVNDQLDTMKMIMNAQMASAIVKNADAIQSMAQSVTTLVSSLIKFWGQDPSKALGLMGAIAGASAGGFVGGLPGAAIGGAVGGVGGMILGRKAKDVSYASNPQWRRLKYIEDTAMNAANEATSYGMAHPFSGVGKSKGVDRLNKRALWARNKRMELEGKFQDGSVPIFPAVAPTGPSGPDPKLPGGAGKPAKPEKAKPEKSAAELEADWQRDFLRARSDLYNSQANLAIEPGERADLEAQRLRNGYFSNNADIDADTGTDAQVREGKKKYTEAQAKLLKGIEKEIFDNEYDRVMRDRDEEIAKQRLDIASSALDNDNDLLSAQSSLARTAQERKGIALKQVANDFALQRLQLEAILASKTATDAEKKVAQARLDMLPSLQGLAEEGARQSNMGPLEAYLKAIPSTSAEVNEAMQNIATQGLDNLTSGLMDVVNGTKDVASAFGDMGKSIINSLIKIGIQALIIKPIAGALFGGAGGGGGIFGSIFNSIGIKGARANGGYTGAGNYLVGERGPEIVSIGANANVVPTSRIKGGANDNAGRAVHITFGSITSNDPAAVKAMAAQAIFEAMPVINQQASDYTIGKIRRANT